MSSVKQKIMRKHIMDLTIYYKIPYVETKELSNRKLLKLKTNYIVKLLMKQNLVKVAPPDTNDIIFLQTVLQKFSKTVRNNVKLESFFYDLL